MKKSIPKPIFQAIAAIMFLGALVLVVYWAITDSGVFGALKTLFMDKSVLIFLLTLLIVLIPVLLVILVLRHFTDMPAIGELLSPEKVFDGLSGAKKETVELHSLAPVWKRVVAFIIDRGIVLLSVVLICIPGMLLYQEVGGVAGSAGLVAFILGLCFAIFYAFARDTVNGQSIGRRLLHIQVIKAETRQPAGFLLCLLRDILLHFIPMPIIELILIFADPHRQRLGDKIAKTYVINTNADIL